MTIDQVKLELIALCPQHRINFVSHWSYYNDSQVIIYTIEVFTNQNVLFVRAQGKQINEVMDNARQQILQKRGSR